MQCTRCDRALCDQGGYVTDDSDALWCPPCAFKAAKISAEEFHKYWGHWHGMSLTSFWPEIMADGEINWRRRRKKKGARK
jgi:hypothetical protein